MQVSSNMGRASSPGLILMVSLFMFLTAVLYYAPQGRTILAGRIRTGKEAGPPGGDHNHSAPGDDHINQLHSMRGGDNRNHSMPADDHQHHSMPVGDNYQRRSLPCDGDDDQQQRAEEVKHRQRRCEGRWIYMYELPREFNEGLLERCRRQEREEQCRRARCVPCERLGENGGLGPLMSKPAAANGRGVGGGSGVVELVPRGAWYKTDQFAAEVIFHERMKGYECLTRDAGQAVAFYVPFYAGVDMAFTLFNPRMQLRDELTQRLLGWLSAQPTWRSAAADSPSALASAPATWPADSARSPAPAAALGPRNDHFLVLGRIASDFQRAPLAVAWGTSLLRQPDFIQRRVASLSIERTFMDRRDIGIPYPTSFHPSSLDDIHTWQELIKVVTRPWLVTFLGASSRKFSDRAMKRLRMELMHQCSANTTQCRAIQCDEAAVQPSSSNTSMDVINCSFGHDEVISALATSVFCLQPGGDSPTRRGFFDSVVAGCIPVVFANNTAYEQYLWHLPSSPSDYSVFISEDDVVSKRVHVLKTLSDIPIKKLIAMQQAVRDLIPRIIYSSASSTSLNSHSRHHFDDAFDLTIHSYLDQLSNNSHM